MWRIPGAFPAQNADLLGLAASARSAMSRDGQFVLLPSGGGTRTRTGQKRKAAGQRPCASSCPAIWRLAGLMRAAEFTSPTADPAAGLSLKRVNAAQMPHAFRRALRRGAVGWPRIHRPNGALRRRCGGGGRPSTRQTMSTPGNGRTCPDLRPFRHHPNEVQRCRPDSGRSSCRLVRAGTTDERAITRS